MGGTGHSQEAHQPPPPMCPACTIVQPQQLRRARKQRLRPAGCIVPKSLALLQMVKQRHGMREPNAHVRVQVQGMAESAWSIRLRTCDCAGSQAPPVRSQRRGCHPTAGPAAPAARPGLHQWRGTLQMALAGRRTAAGGGRCQKGVSDRSGELAVRSVNHSISASLKQDAFPNGRNFFTSVATLQRPAGRPRARAPCVANWQHK